MRRLVPIDGSSMAVAALAAFLAFPFSILAQEPSGDVIELTLEEILETALVPTGIMGSHVHQKGEWMLGYHYMSMEMDGNRDETRRLGTSEVLELFPVTPLRMTTETQVFEIMYGVTDRFTLMLKAPFYQKEMDHVTRSGIEFTTASEGVGDVELMTHFVLRRRGPHWWVSGLAVGLPTGSIEEKDDLPSGPDQLLPYPMQLGSGSTRVTSMLNYLYQGRRWLSAFHAMANLVVAENNRGYEVGDQFHLSWVAVLKASDSFGISLRVNAMRGENYSGADPDLNPAIVHTADPERRGFDRAAGLLGLNFYVTGGPFAGSRFLIEGGRPFYQSLDGPQLEVDLMVNLAWQWTF